LGLAIGKLPQLGDFMNPLDPGRGTDVAPVFPAGFTASLAFDEFSAMAAAARGWDHHYLKLTPGPFRGSLTMAHTAGLQVGHATWSGGILAKGSVPRGARTFALVSSDAGSARISGEPIGADDLVTQSDREELHFHHPRGCAMLVASFGHDLLERVTDTFLGDGWGDSFGDRHLLRLKDSGGGVAALRRVIETATTADPARLCEPGFAMALEQAAGEALLSRLDLPPRRVAPAERLRLARRAEEYLRANATRPVSIAELVAAVGAPERTLHEACRDYFGLPPIAFLRAQRLHGARLQLVDGRAGSVTEAATDWGFYHFGEFSGAYRRLFDETPSQTLRRARGPA
jgi:AraC family ethanolamine operon transcriptional activator